MSNKKRHTKRHLSERTRAALRRAGKKGAEAAHAAQRAKYTPEELHVMAQRRGKKGGHASQAVIRAKYTPEELHVMAQRRARKGGSASQAAQRAKYTPEELSALRRSGGGAGHAALRAKYTPEELHAIARKGGRKGAAPAFAATLRNHGYTRQDGYPEVSWGVVMGHIRWHVQLGRFGRRPCALCAPRTPRRKRRAE